MFALSARQHLHMNSGMKVNRGMKVTAVRGRALAFFFFSIQGRTLETFKTIIVMFVLSHTPLEVRQTNDYLKKRKKKAD